MIEWRIIPGFEDYEVSERGDVRRCVPKRGGPVGKSLKSVRDSAGYRLYGLTPSGQPGITKRARAHRLVALAFLGLPPAGKPEVCHKDGSRQNDHWPNLYWGSHRENMQDAVIHGVSAKGVRNGHAKLTENTVREIRQQCADGISQAALARRLGVSTSVISEAARGVTWRHVT